MTAVGFTRGILHTVGVVSPAGTNACAAAPRHTASAMTTSGAPFTSTRPVIAMIHVGALPGTPASGLSLAELEKQAVCEAKIFRDAGVHGLMLENMHDTP